ncbi:vacuolar protein sorting-associated protein 1 [Nematocida homosporus]|uniref:vacuolar protein sorting-associated protein 1 n=1 Tax=Nematocida homosporus TaxID=1912981 RepID=UPI00221F0DC8|nr:vacuolar protein sorting-associated protein 1 [Nematocida homosporus]KAI5187479.1 vacuolar protein sorting-associated protein 1 [Nematocida homosporus]
MKDIVQKVNTLHSLCMGVNNPLNLPQIVVVGAQSSGKSSVLENIVGGDFLPRGSGMVTRRPLMIQIVPSPDSETSCSFGHIPNQVFVLEQVRGEIEKETDRMLNSKNDVSAIPIVLKIQMPNGLPLTLIDLPGIIKVPMEGQPASIVKKVDDIIKSYIQNRNTIILAVTPANLDISNSDALKVAKEVDPNLERTLCLLTKVDLMDPGTDLLSVLQGNMIKVKLGFVPVICRGEKSLKTQTTIAEALATEQSFFAAHPAYAAKSSFCGIPYLIQRLHAVLSESIHKSIPYLQEKVDLLIAKTEKDLHELGDPVIDERQLLMQIITEFKHQLDQKVSGSPSHTAAAPTLFLIDGARIAYSLDITFAKFIRNLPVFEASDREIETILMNASGVFGNSSTAQSLSHFVAHAIEKITPHCIHLSDRILMEMTCMVNTILDQPHIARFTHLKRALAQATTRYLKERSTASISLIKQFLQWNAVYIRSPSCFQPNEAPNSHYPDINTSPTASPSYTSHIPPKFYWPPTNSTSSTPTPISTNPNTTSTSTNSTSTNSTSTTTNPISNTDSLRNDILRQITHLKTVVIEQVPKIIVLEIVHKTLTQIQQRLITDIYLPEDLPTLLEEEEAIQQKRQTLSATLSSLYKAQQITRTF